MHGFSVTVVRLCIECRKSSDRWSKKSTRAKKSSKSDADHVAPEKPKTPVEKKSAPVQRLLIPGKLTVRRVPHIDVDTLMMRGVKEMDVIWNSAAEAAEAMMRREHTDWKVATVVGAMKHATKKLIAKKAAAKQQEMLLQQLATAVSDVTSIVNVDEQSEQIQQPVDQAVISQSCRTDLLKHLLSSAPLVDVNNATYE